MTGAPAPEIAVVVVNYGTAELAIEAVESVRERAHGGRAVEIHLVDNASPGGDAERLARVHRERGWGPQVVLHLETVNHGFGRGNNVALEALAARAAPPDKVFLLNPDARLGNEALDVLAAFLDAHPKAGAAGAAIALPDGRPVTAAFRFPSLASELERSLNFGPVSRRLARFRTSLPPDLREGRVDWVSGAAVMFRFAALRDAGFFDPAYFLYYEEVDLMRTLTGLGWEVWFVPDARAIHHEGAATGVGGGRRKRRPAYVYDSWRHYFLKNHGRGYALATAAVALLGGAGNVLQSRLRGQDPWLPLHFFGDQVRLVLRPLAGLGGGCGSGR